MKNQNYPTRAEYRSSHANKKSNNKRFYKRWWFWLIVVIILAAAGGVGGYMAFKNPPAKQSTSKVVKKKKSTAKKSTTKTSGISLAKYNGIYISQSDGLSSVTLQQLLGKASGSTTSTVQNLKTTVLTWNEVANGSHGSKVTVNFANDHAISKSISGLKVTRPQKLGLTQYNKIQNGETEADLLLDLGKPNGYNETSVNGTTSKMLNYTSGIKGESGSNFIINITNGTVSGKSQTGLE